MRVHEQQRSRRGLIRARGARGRRAAHNRGTTRWTRRAPNARRTPARTQHRAAAADSADRRRHLDGPEDLGPHQPAPVDRPQHSRERERLDGRRLRSRRSAPQPRPQRPDRDRPVDTDGRRQEAAASSSPRTTGSDSSSRPTPCRSGRAPTRTPEPRATSWPPPGTASRRAARNRGTTRWAHRAPNPRLTATKTRRRAAAADSTARFHVPTARR